MSGANSEFKIFSNGNKSEWSQSNLIIIQKDRNEFSKKNLMIIENENYKAQSNIEYEINKEKIDKRIKEIEQNILIINKNPNENIKKFSQIERAKLKTTNNNYSENSDKIINKSKNQQSNQAFISSENTLNENDEKRTKIISNLKIEKNKIEEDINNKEYNEFNYYDEDDEEEKNYIILNYNQEDLIEHKCYICDKRYYLNQLLTATCQRHFLCKKCFKNFYEEKIEEGKTNFKCSVFKCEAPVDINMIKSIVSENHFKLINKKKDINTFNNNNINNYEEAFTLRLQKKYNLKNSSSSQLKLYTQRHVIDINSNENFYMFHGVKEQYCPLCNEESLFSKTGTHFIKCLNCFHKICKHCFKEFNDLHLDIANENHCKIYFRNKEKYENENNEKLLIELLMVIASFYFLFSSDFIYIRNAVKWFFCSKGKYNINFALNILIYFFSIIIFLISFPIIFIGFPYFPIFISIFGF